MELDSYDHLPVLGSHGPGRTRAMSNVARIAGLSAVVLGVGLASGGIAGAATTGGATTSPGGHTSRYAGHFDGTRPAAVGTVSSLGANTFKLTSRNGTVVTVNVTSATTYRDRGVTAPSFSAVTVDSHVAVVGPDTSNTVAATSVLIGGFGGHHFGNGLRTPPAAIGTVSSLGTNTFKLTSRNGSVVTVSVTSATKYRDRGVTAPSFSNVTVGSRVAVVGPDTSNTVAATSVLIGGFGGHHFG